MSQRNPSVYVAGRPSNAVAGAGIRMVVQIVEVPREPRRGRFPYPIEGVRNRVESSVLVTSWAPVVNAAAQR